MSEPSLTLAEFVLPGHPDKVCDRIADLLVDAACARDPRALVGVEVACHRGVVYVTGCVATDPPLTRADVDALARRGFREAGYGAAWGPDPETLKVEADVRLERLDDDLRRLRDISDDQAITIGWAGGRREDNYLPRAHRLSWLACQALRALREEAGLGPDGKVLVVERGGEVERMSLSLQHRTGAPRVALYRVAARVAAAVGLWDLDRVKVNGGGDFDVGGPAGDNGLSGKKLVMDAYGPTVPIGGGAWSGKDPHKVDRLGALRARQLALRAVRLGMGQTAQVSFGWQPGDAAPSAALLEIDGRPRPLAALGRAELSIEGAWRALGLGERAFAERADGSWFQRSE